MQFALNPFQGMKAFCWSIFLSFLYSLTQADVHLYVSPQGSDSNDGLNASKPLQSLLKAITLANKTRTDANSVVYIELMRGYHDLNRTLVIPYNKVVLRAYANQEVHVTGGRRIPSELFKHVSNTSILSWVSKEFRQNVRVVHLADLNITDYGKMNKYGFGHNRVAPLEVFYNGRPLHLARWPNTGFINIVDVPNGEHGLKFQFNSTRPAGWHTEAEPWVYGYWYWSWADESVPVANIDIHNSTVTLKTDTNYGLRTGHYNEPNSEFARQGGYFRFINILSELDTPGEYYIDKQNGDMYLWMPSSEGNIQHSDIVYVSLIEDCIRLNNGLRDVQFEGFILEACRSQGIFGSNVHNVQIRNMEIRNTGGAAVSLTGDNRNVLVSQCLIHDGDGGVWISGGNRNTLEGSGNVIEHNEIYSFAREGAVGKHAVSIYGVENLVRYNHIYDGQYTAVWYMGNENKMEYNHIHHVCVNASDCGALHTGRDWTTRGNVIRFNIVHHTLRLVPGADCRGVMLDDQSSSTRITNNVFFDNHVHVNIGGGRDNIIANNVMYNATRSSMQVDGRGAGHSFDQTLVKNLHAVPYTGPLWSSRYPELASIDSHNASLPEGNQISKNIIYNENHRQFIAGLGGWLDNPKYVNVTQTRFSSGSSDHFNVTISDYRVKCFAADWANKVNFQQVPTLNDVGTGPVQLGPFFLNRHGKVYTTGSNGICTTHAPSIEKPVPAYLPDGSRENNVFNVSKVGCWFVLSACTDHPTIAHTLRDVDGELHNGTGSNETACLHRAVDEWKFCGAHKNEQVVAVYGPTGATAIAGDGCFMATWGCPLHGGPSDGHILTHGSIYRDTYAEQHDGAASNEEACLRRAFPQWVYCGANKNHPVTSIYRPTGAIRTAGFGCWIHVQKCTAHPKATSMFYDSWGATNFHTDDDEMACLNQSEYYWTECGSNHMYPVTAYFRPKATSKTFP